ncbi:MAG: hydroxymethylbilane synthase [Alicyclobacillus sp.]|nr:hydroxymethylbilane synthase [Alicyclobacillus sp.]
MDKLRVATRTSALALRQTQWVLDQLHQRVPDLTFELVPVVTRGDRILDVALAKIGGKGLFVSEVEAQLLAGNADLAVHSLKDVPAELAPGLVFGSVPVRADARDALVSARGQGLAALPPGARIGTSSLRRSAQLLALRPDLQIVPLRGNIDTRLRKLENEGLDAIVLAAAGLERMGWSERITERLAPEVCLPAVGQGILALECRADNPRVQRWLAALHDPVTAAAARAERALLTALNGGCQVPLAGYAQTLPDGGVWLRGLVASLDGRWCVRAEARGSDPEAVGREVARRLREQGADRLLETTATVQPGG